MKKHFATLIVCSLTVISATPLMAVPNIPCKAVTSQATTKGQKTQEEIKKIAQDKVPGAKIVKIELDTENGKTVYEVEMEKGTTEYDLEIDATTGKINKCETERKD